MKHLTTLFVVVAIPALLVAAFMSWRWSGVALVAGALMMWAMLHFTRLLHVLKRSAQSPIGYVGSAVMLNAKLKKGVSLLHVMALTKSMGQLQTPKGAQPEVFRWTDPSDSHVTCTFVNGKLDVWELVRPPQS
jgi:hypothetical protein